MGIARILIAIFIIRPFMFIFGNKLQEKTSDPEVDNNKLALFSIIITIVFIAIPLFLYFYFFW